MTSLNQIRTLIAIFFLVFISEELLLIFYDPTLGSPLLEQSKKIVNDLLQHNLIYNVLGLLAIISLSYSSAALWFGYNSGRWMYILFLILEGIIQCLTPVIAYSGVTSVVDCLYFLILGMILSLIFMSSLKNIFLEKNRLTRDASSLCLLYF